MKFDFITLNVFKSAFENYYYEYFDTWYIKRMIYKSFLYWNWVLKQIRLLTYFWPLFPLRINRPASSIKM